VKLSTKIVRINLLMPIVFALLLLCGCPKSAKEAKLPSEREKPEPSASVTGDKAQKGEQALADDKSIQDKEPSGDMPAAADSVKLETADEAADEPVEKPRDLGPPLADNADNLKKLHPVYPVWLDAAGKQVVMVGEICQTNAPLEMFICPRGIKDHESIISVNTEAYIVHAALVAVGAKPGKPVQYMPEYVPATGSEIDITVRWKDEKGKIQTARAQDWIREMKTGKELSHNWVFGGSFFWKDEATGKEYYQAEGGDFICVSNFPDAMLDLPIKSSESNADLLFQAFTERIPPRGTPVTVFLKPKIQ
jgi:hypothetical protein